MPGWLNLRTILGLALFLISFAAGNVVLRSADGGTLVWAATRDLGQGAVLSGPDLKPVRVDLPPEQLAGYLASTVPLERSSLVRPVRKGELIPAGWVVEGGTASSRSIALPVTWDHAVGGALRPGDRVDVFATLKSVRGQARTTLLVRNAEVEEVLRSDGLMTEGDDFAGVTLAVPPDEAAAIAFAIRTSEVDVALVEGPLASDVADTITASDL